MIIFWVAFQTAPLVFRWARPSVSSLQADKPPQDRSRPCAPDELIKAKFPRDVDRQLAALFYRSLPNFIP